MIDQCFGNDTTPQVDHARANELVAIGATKRIGESEHPQTHDQQQRRRARGGDAATIQSRRGGPAGMHRLWV